MSSASELTPTSYALLGLLAIKTWTTYELAQQMDRTLNRFWPRARSKVYEEPKKLVAHGLARASRDRVGRRARTTYAITAKGRRVLAAWLREPGAGPVLEFEQLMQVFFADSGSTTDVIRTLRTLREWVHERTMINIDVGRSYVEGRSPFPERAAINAVVGRFLDDFLETLDQWAEWAEQIVGTWPDDPRQATPDNGEVARSVQHGVERVARFEAASARW